MMTNSSHQSWMTEMRMWNRWGSALAHLLLAAGHASWCADLSAPWTNKGGGWGWVGGCWHFLLHGFMPLRLSLVTGTFSFMALRPCASHLWLALSPSWLYAPVPLTCDWHFLLHGFTPLCLSLVTGTFSFMALRPCASHLWLALSPSWLYAPVPLTCDWHFLLHGFTPLCLALVTGLSVWCWCVARTYKLHIEKYIKLCIITEIVTRWPW